MSVIVVHGGAGRWPEGWRTRAVEGVTAAAETGRDLLRTGASALEAVVEAVASMENDPVFNAGTGSALNVLGGVEMDAGVMVGVGLRTGNVAALERTRNPVRVARAVLENTPHVLLAGDGALRFARAAGHKHWDPVTPERREQWRERRDALGTRKTEESWEKVLARYPDLGGTVGAVALDGSGLLAAATSTGGTMMKLAGRVGDTPVPGAGNYADTFAAVSATGVGELMLRFLTAKSVCDRVAAGLSAGDAAREVTRAMFEAVGREVGMVVVDREGRIGIVHGTPAMPHAWSDPDGVVHAAMENADAVTEFAPPAQDR